MSDHLANLLKGGDMNAIMAALSQAGQQGARARLGKQTSKYKPKQPKPPIGEFRIEWQLSDIGAEMAEFWHPIPALSRVKGILYHDVHSFDIAAKFPERKAEMESFDKKREEKYRKKKRPRFCSSDDDDDIVAQPNDAQEVSSTAQTDSFWRKMQPGRHRIGVLKGTKFHRHCEGVDFVEAADAIDQETYDAAEFLESLIDSEKKPKGSEVRGDISEMMLGSHLYVRSIEVAERYRGLGLGLYLLYQAMMMVNDHMSATFLEPFALSGSIKEPECWRRHDTPKGLSEDELAQLKAKDAREIKAYQVQRRVVNQKLVAYYKLLGFEVVKAHNENPADDLSEQRGGNKKKSAGKGVVKVVEWLGLWNGYVTPRLRNVLPHLWDDRGSNDNDDDGDDEDDDG